MSKTASATGNSQPKAKERKLLVPPDERFWKRYSPHHEFPLSTVASFVLHALAIGILVVGAILVARLGLEDKAPEVGGLMIGDPGTGDGPPAGLGTSPVAGIPQGSERTDVIQNSTPTVPMPPIEALAPADAKPVDLADVSNSENVRYVDDSAVLAALSDTGKAAREKIKSAIAGKGGVKGQPGGDPNSNAAIGPGPGGPGPGGGGRLTQREKRQLRWVMMFNTFDGRDYAKQLNGLGAMLAIQQADGQFMLYRDLSRAPAQGKIEDLKGLDRIYWVDDKPQSVQSLSMALGIAPPPSHVVAFFPADLEKKLLQKELTYLKSRRRGGNENDIRETRFQVVPRGGTRYEPEVVSQNYR